MRRWALSAWALRCLEASLPESLPYSSLQTFKQCEQENYTLAAEDPKQRSFGESAEHSLDWGPTVWGPTFSVHEIWSLGSTQWTGGVQSGGLQSEGLRSDGQQTWATGFGAGKPLTGLGPYSLGAYSLEAYSLGPPTLELEKHSLDWEPTVWEPTVLGHQFWSSTSEAPKLQFQKTLVRVTLG